jgi:TM2 domain-containing membrane protein YozV
MKTSTAKFLSDLPSNKAMVATKQIEDGSIKTSISYFLLIGGGFIWLAGLQHFYRKAYIMGLLYLFTLGFLGIGMIIDLFLIPAYVREYNSKVEDEVVIAFGGVVEKEEVDERAEKAEADWKVGG